MKTGEIGANGKEYKIAIDEMLQKTGTITAQWTIVESNNKRYSRIRILKTITEALEKELNAKSF